MTLQSNVTADVLASNEELRAIAIGEGLGKRAIGKFFVTLARHIGDKRREYHETGTLYTWRFDVIRLQETHDGILPEDLTKTPSGNSLSGQLSKARAITNLGVIERTRVGTIDCLTNVAKRPVCQWAYKPLCVAASAISDTLASEPNATDERLMDAAQEAMDAMAKPKAKTLESELAKMLDAFVKLETKTFEADVVRANKRAAEDVSGAVRKTLTRLLNATKAVAADDAMNA